MKELFYYLRDKDHRPLVTVCLVRREDGMVMARGVAICAPCDIPDTRKGRQKARGRAIAALHPRQLQNASAYYIGRDAAKKTLEAVGTTALEFCYTKAGHMPVLTGSEAAWLEALDYKAKQRAVPWPRENKA